MGTCCLHCVKLDLIRATCHEAPTRGTPRGASIPSALAALRPHKGHATCHIGVLLHAVMVACACARLKASSSSPAQQRWTEPTAIVPAGALGSAKVADRGVLDNSTSSGAPGRPAPPSRALRGAHSMHTSGGQQSGRVGPAVPSFRRRCVCALGRGSPRSCSHPQLSWWWGVFRRRGKVLCPCDSEVGVLVAGSGAGANSGITSCIRRRSSGLASLPRIVGAAILGLRSRLVSGDRAERPCRVSSRSLTALNHRCCGRFRR